MFGTDTQQPAAILTLSLICTIIFISYFGFKKPGFFDKYKFEVESILRRRQYYRIISSAFLHTDIGHLFLNCFCFYSFAEHIEIIFGRHIILVIFFLSLLGGSFLSLLFHRKNYDYSAVGASGAVSGIMFASIFLLPGGEIAFLLMPIGIPASIFAILYVVISIYGIKAKRDNLGHEAHLGGALTGMLVTLAIYPKMVFSSLWTFLGIFALMTGIILYNSRNLFGLLFDNFQSTGKCHATTINHTKQQKMKQELDDLLSKVSDKGLHSLSRHEKKKLQSISQKLKTQPHNYQNK